MPWETRLSFEPCFHPPREMGADAIEIGKTIHPHLTLGESVGMAARLAHGSCTDLLPGKK
jgi:dihydrolipoamide dehydrogenase